MSLLYILFSDHLPELLRDSHYWPYNCWPPLFSTGMPNAKMTDQGQWYVFYYWWLVIIGYWTPTCLISLIRIGIPRTINNRWWTIVFISPPMPIFLGYYPRLCPYLLSHHCFLLVVRLLVSLRYGHMTPDYTNLATPDHTRPSPILTISWLTVSMIVLGFCRINPNNLSNVGITVATPALWWHRPTLHQRLSEMQVILRTISCKRTIHVLSNSVSIWFIYYIRST